MNWAIIALNREAIDQAKRLREKIDRRIDIYVPRKHLEIDLIVIESSLKELSKELFARYDALIYIMAMGIIVREIAPHIKHKSIDPAVLCLTIDGQYIIPVLSGHLGGANAIANEIGSKFGAKPVISTASDLLEKPAVDMIAKEERLTIASFEDAKFITSQLIEHKKVVILNESYKLSKDYGIPEIQDRNSDEFLSSSGTIYISYNKQPSFDNKPYAHLVPKRLVLGIGSRKGIDPEKLEAFFEEVMSKHNLHKQSILGITSIELKKNEEAIVALADKLKVPFITYNTKTIRTVIDQFEESEFVRKIIGVGAVAMPCAYLLSGKGKCLVKRVVDNGMTIAIYEECQKANE